MSWIRIKKVVFFLPRVLEIIIGIIISIVIFIAVIGTVQQISPSALIEYGGLFAFLQGVTEIIIAIELVKVIFSHTLDATLEIIIMAIVRQIITEHLTPQDTMIFVLAIAVLFIVRKFFFIKKLDRISDDDVEKINWKFWDKTGNKQGKAHKGEKPVDMSKISEENSL